MRPFPLTVAALAATAALSLPTPARGGDASDALTECGLTGAVVGLIWPPGGAAFIAGCIVGYELEKSGDSADGSFPTFNIAASIDAAEWGDPCIPGCVCVTEPCPCCPLVPWIALKDEGAITLEAGVWNPAQNGWKPVVQSASFQVIDLESIAQAKNNSLPIEEWSWGNNNVGMSNPNNPGGFIGVFDPAEHKGLTTSYLIRMNLVLASGEVETAYVAAGVLCEGDADFDGDVDSADLNTVLANFGAFTPLAGMHGDVNFDGGTDSDDLNLVLSKFGDACAP